MRKFVYLRSTRRRRPAAKRGHAPHGRSKPGPSSERAGFGSVLLPVLPPRGRATPCFERDLTPGVCYRPGADGPLGRCSGFWRGRCLSSLGLSAVGDACRLSALASARGFVARAISRSKRCFHRARSVSSWVPPVGRGSWGLMPLAARHTAISPISAVLGWLPGAAQTGLVSPWQAWSWIWSARSATTWDRFAR